MSTEILFANYAPRTLEPKNSIGSKWPRMLYQLDLGAAVSGTCDRYFYTRPIDPALHHLNEVDLDLIRTEDLIPGALPAAYELGEQGHLFERIHRKDPYVVVDYLAELGHGTKQYSLEEVE